MFENIMENCPDWENEESLRDYLNDILDKKVFDHAGLIYGMGHAVYTLSDPREVILKRYAKFLAEEKGKTREFALYEKIRLTEKICRADFGIYAGNEAKSGLAQDLDDCHNSERGGQRARRGEIRSVRNEPLLSSVRHFPQYL